MNRERKKYMRKFDTKIQYLKYKVLRLSLIHILDSVETLEEAIASVRAAQNEFAKYTQEQVDEIFKAAAIAANKQRIPLAKMAVEETGMGVDVYKRQVFQCTGTQVLRQL